MCIEPRSLLEKLHQPQVRLGRHLPVEYSFVQTALTAVFAMSNEVFHVILREAETHYLQQPLLENTSRLRILTALSECLPGP